MSGAPTPRAASAPPDHSDPHEELRTAFVGQSVFFAQCALERASGPLRPCFVDFRAGAAAEALRARLEELDPDVVVVFRPEIIPRGLFGSLRALTIGYLTEPLPRTPRTSHADLKTRMWWLQQVDPGNFDRIISFDPLIAETAARVLPVWRSLPIPVADSLYMDVRERSRPPRLLFLGRSTEHREEQLAAVKARHPLVHVGHGLFGDRLASLLAETDVQINLHNNPYPTFENRVCIGLAAGHLVISEALSPTHGLQARREYLEANSPAELLELVDRIALERDAFADVQAAGRAAAERFRASVVYPPLITEALDDVAALGSERRRD